MKREFLKDLGLTDEQIDKIMKENGKDIENAKKGVEDLKVKLKETEANLETVQAQLEIANKQIEDFKEMDIEGIKRAAEEYKIKYEEAKEKAAKELEAIKFDYALENALTQAKARNIKAVKALLDMEGLKFNDGEIVGLKDQLEKIKSENDYLFDSDEGTPEIVLPGSKGKDEPIDFSKLTYSQMVELAQKNPNIKF